MALSRYGKPLLFLINQTARMVTFIKQLQGFLLPVLIAFIACRPGHKAETINGNIRSMLQDKKNNYWFGTDRDGVYRYDGKTLTLFTIKDGLCNNQVRNIQEDASGNIWFGTGGGISSFNGKVFSMFTNLQLSSGPDNRWKTGLGDLWLEARGIYRCNGNSIAHLTLPKTDLDSAYTKNQPGYSPYGVYCTLKDKKGNVWFGTQSLGVCRFDGKSFTWFTEKGLGGPAVRALFEDKNGNLWFGNNDFGTDGGGLFRYDGKSLTNFTDEKGLSNYEYSPALKTYAKPGTLSRIWTINEDNNGNLWIGTADSGAWRYDGKNLTRYTIEDGLASNSVSTIYKDKKGELWFGTTEGVCKFNGRSFTKFSIN
jgi:ligand-binding sensor domain-containing protein